MAPRVSGGDGAGRAPGTGPRGAAAFERAAERHGLGPVGWRWLSFPDGLRAMVPGPGGGGAWEPLAAVHRRWAELRRDTRPPHPLRPVLRAWFERPPKEAADTRRADPILPAVHRGRDTGRLFGGGPLAGGRNGPQLPLLPHGDGAADGPRVPLLELTDAAGVPVMARGRGAPLVLRLAVESLLSTPFERRDHCRLSVTVRELRDALYPRGWKRRRDWPRVLEAIEMLDGLWLPIRDRYGEALWRPWALRRLPREGAALDAPVLLDVALPDGAEGGPVIDRAALRRLGLDSGPRYRAALAVQSVQWLPGRTRVPVPGGKGWRTWTRDGTRYEVLTAADRRRLAFGDGDRKHRTRREVDAAYEALPGVAVVSRDATDPKTGRRGWLVVPEAAADAMRGGLTGEPEGANRGVSGP